MGETLFCVGGGALFDNARSRNRFVQLLYRSDVLKIQRQGPILETKIAKKSKTSNFKHENATL